MYRDRQSCTPFHRLFVLQPPCPAQYGFFSTSQAIKAKFEYDELYNGRQATKQPRIRLLELLSGGAADEVHCRLKVVPLSASPAYEAVSYCWGDPQDRQAIKCNNGELEITRNLKEALRGLRLVDRTRILWVDAVCVDQSNTNEKNEQVQLMRSIFAKASRTLVWLGHQNDGNEQKISRLAIFAIKFGLTGLRGQKGKANLPSISLLDTRTGVSRTILSLSNEFYINLIRMLQRPWFQRAWVVQEVVVSKRSTVVWNYAEYDWEDFVQTLRGLSSLKMPLAYIISLQHVAAIENERLRQNTKNLTLLGVLLRQQRCLATDPRDKIYSFCGLVGEPPEGSSVRIDYHDDPKSIYIRWAKKIIADTSTLAILSRPPLPRSSQIEQLPSWVPDWSICSSSKAAHTFGIGPRSLANTEGWFATKTRSRFSAAGNSRCELKVSDSNHELLIESHPVDTVREVGPIFEGVQLPNTITNLKSIAKGWTNTLRTALQAQMVITAWQELVKEQPNIIRNDGQSADEVFWQTVCTGEHTESPKVASAVEFWKRETRNAWFRIKYIPEFLYPVGLVYCFWVLVGHLISRRPLLEYELQNRFIFNRRIVTTEQGYVGLAGCETQVGDRIYLCKGSGVPLIFRRIDQSDKWRLIGDVYIDGVMQGELFDAEKCQKMVIT
jgi:Heterokaryon incompatibility protein (HET)